MGGCVVGFFAGRDAAGTGEFFGQTEIFATGVYTETLSIYNFDPYEILGARGRAGWAVLSAS